MKVKKLIFEQSPIDLPKKKTPEEKEQILKTAMDLGCFDDIIDSPTGLVIDKFTVKLSNGEPVFKAKGKESGKIYYIYADPQRIVDANNLLNYFEWQCAPLKRQLSAISQKAEEEKKRKEEEDKNKLSDVQVKPEEQSQTEIDKLIQSIETQREKQTPESCAKSINALFKFYQDAKKGYNFDQNDVKKLQLNSKRCLAEPDIKNKLFFAKLPLLGDKFQKRLEILKDINPTDTRLGIFSLMENRTITKAVKETLIEIKTKKENERIQKQIVEARMRFLLENFEKFESMGLKKQVKIGFKILREIHQLKKVELINENLGSLFKGIYGKSFDSSVATISEPLFNVIFTRISLDEDLKSNILNSIKNKTSELISSMDSCFDFAKFLTDVIVEEYAKKLDMLNHQSNDVIHSSFMDAVDDEMFRKNLNTKLEAEICKLYDKFTENAKNLMVRMSAL